jgi:hypothetical protein
MTSKEKQFELVKNEIAELDKPKKYQKEKNTDAAIGAMKKELSGIEGQKEIHGEIDGSDQGKKNSHKIIAVIVLIVVLLVVLIFATKFFGLW